MTASKDKVEVPPVTENTVTNAPVEAPKAKVVRGKRAIRFDNKHYHDSTPFSTPPSPAYSAVTYYNSPGFLNG